MLVAGELTLGAEFPEFQSILEGVDEASGAGSEGFQVELVVRYADQAYSTSWTTAIFEVDTGKLIRQSTVRTKLQGGAMTVADLDFDSSKQLIVVGTLSQAVIDERITALGGGGGGAWGSITGTLSAQADLQSALDAKLTADTANVTAAGALMDSEVTNLAAVKAFDPSAYEPSDATILKDADIGVSVQAYNANYVVDATYVKTDQNFTNADHSKLDGIEALADVTDTTNVTAAGAAMLTGATFTGTVTATDFIGPLNGAVQFTAKNRSGGTITKGQAIAISGISGNTPEVTLADADAATMPAFGLAATTASDNNDLEIVTFGSLKGIQTDYAGWAVGQPIYVATTAGTLTNVPPTGEAAKIQNIGTVERVHSSNGTIKVGGAGRSNATPNLDEGNVFIGNASNQSAARALVVADTTGLQADLDGKLGNSEVTNLAQVKAFDTTDYATSAQGTTADNALQNLVEDTTPQLGGNLDLQTHSIVGNGGTSGITVSADGSIVVSTAGGLGLNVFGAGTKVADVVSTDSGIVQYRMRSDLTDKRVVALDYLGTTVHSQIRFGNESVDIAGAAIGTPFATFNSTGASGAFVVDEDDMVSDSATRLPTQQSVKAYVDAGLTSADSYEFVTRTGTGSLALVQNAWTDLTWATAVDNYGTGITWSGTNPERLTVTETGIYRISGTLDFYSTSTRAQGTAKIQVNGVDVSGASWLGATYIRSNSNTWAHWPMSVASKPLQLTAGDYVTIAAVEVTGAGTNNPPLASDNGLTEISVVLSRSEINLERVR